MLRLLCLVLMLGVTGCALCDSNYPHGPVADGPGVDGECTTGRAGSVLDPAGVNVMVESPPE
jgi:hypothetical protein